MRCKYCRVELGLVEASDLIRMAEITGKRCFDAYACRDRMADRERRIVRVFWRVYFDVPESRRRNCEGRVCACGQSYCLRCCPKSTDYDDRLAARQWGVGWAQTKCIPTRVRRVTVRRKAKP
jgi:hypothetical protein